MPLAEAEVDRSADIRWQLIDRIVQTEPFHKSTRLPALLRYLAESTLSGERDGLTEQKIGTAVFGKPADYTPAEDSSVRVYVRQLRLRLHEYFDSEGRDEPIIVEIPKGGYTLQFHPALRAATQDATTVTALARVQADERFVFRRWLRWFPWMALGFALVCSVGWYRSASLSRHSSPPWPLNDVMQDRVQTTLVLADIGYALRMLGDKEIPLDQYVDRSYIKSVTPQKMDPGEARLVHYMEVSQITSVADAHATATLTKLAGPLADNLVIRSARDLNSHDLDHGNYVFVGTKTSNPWAELFEDRLNFRFIEDYPGGPRYISNKIPLTGEQQIYRVPENTGSSGEDYATLAVLPIKNGNGSVLLIQGLRLEGTEAVIRLLDMDETRMNLQRRLVEANGQALPRYFETLLHARSVAGAPVSIDFVAVRVIQP